MNSSSTTSMEQSPSCQTSCFSADKFPFLWNPKIRYCIHKSFSLVPSGTYPATPIHSAPSSPVSIRSMLILSSYLCISLPSLLPSEFPTKILYAFCISRVCCTYFALFILFVLITQIVFSDDSFTLMWETKFRIHIK